MVEHGVPGVVAPVPSRGGPLWSEREGRRLVLLPWVSGARALDGGMSEEHWVSFGKLLAQVHTTAVTEAMEQYLPPRTTRTIEWRPPHGSWTAGCTRSSTSPLTLGTSQITSSGPWHRSGEGEWPAWSEPCWIRPTGSVGSSVNVRASLLLVKAFAAQYRPRPEGGRVVLFTSGQHLGPAPTEIPYAATKGAQQQITATLADALAERDITVNCINPGPTDTGWATPDQETFVARHMPRGRWNSPDEAADVVALLLSTSAATITGQVVDAEGGFRRFTT